MSNDYRSKNNPVPTSAQEIHDTLTNADFCIESDVDNFSAIADLAIEALGRRKSTTDSIKRLESIDVRGQLPSDTEFDIADIVIALKTEESEHRKVIAEAINMLEAFELNDEFDSTLDAVIDLLRGPNL